MENKKPLIVQGDMTLLVEVDSPLFDEVCEKISHFAELVKNLEYLHTYAITPLSLWNSASTGFLLEDILSTLNEYSRYPIPENLINQITSISNRYGKINLIKEYNQFFIETEDANLMLELSHTKVIKQHLDQQISETKYRIKPMARGLIKMELIAIGYPAKDIAGYVNGLPFPFKLSPTLNNGSPFTIRDYQQKATKVFHAGGAERGGSGVIVLPCGAGKTIVGIAAMAKCQTHTLILTTNVMASQQWVREVAEKTTIRKDQIAEYNGRTKNIAEVTIVTYQILSYRRSDDKSFKHFHLFSEKRWGLIIYDEVHLLPAPLFRLCADVQATRRLGLTATLVREDHKESDVFSLIGPQKYNLPWKTLESQGWIAKATCTEIRIPILPKIKLDYAVASVRDKNKIAACNPYKTIIVKQLLKENSTANTIIIGQYIEQLTKLSKELGLPLMTGSTPNVKRIELLDQFRNKEIKTIILSKVGNFAIDLPDANVLIQISGTFGSRQEEAQRLGRLLRPKQKNNQADFYSLVTQDTREQDFAMNRQLFLVEQGYDYKICYKKM